MLQGESVHTQEINASRPEFAQIFLILTLGAVVVTLNSKLLGGTM